MYIWLTTVYREPAVEVATLSALLMVLLVDFLLIILITELLADVRQCVGEVTVRSAAVGLL